MKRKLLPLLFVLFSFLLIGCSSLNFGNPTPIDTSDTVPTAVVIESVDNIFKINVGETAQLKAKVSPETAEQTVTWSSNNKQVATVDEAGLVKGISVGNAKITASATKIISALKTVTVQGHFYITIEEEKIDPITVDIIGENEMYVDQILKLSLTTEPLTTKISGTWSSSNEEVASVDQNGRVFGKIAGNVTITYFTNETLQATHSLEIKPRSGTPTSISIVGRNQLEVGEQLKLRIATDPLGSENTVTWDSSNKDVAIVSENGVLVGFSAGKTTITAVSTLSNNVITSMEFEVNDYYIDKSTEEKNRITVHNITKNSVLGVSNYQVNSVGKLVRESIGSGFVYKIGFKLKDGSLINNIEELPSFDEVDKYFYYLITNRHVIQGSDQVKIYLHTIDKEIPATLVQYDDKVDIAVIYFEYSEYIKPLKFADSDYLQSGMNALAIGNPSGYDFSSSLTTGIISKPKVYLADDTDNDGVNDWDAEYILHQVPINPGNSGGPLLNFDGEVIGVNTLKFASNNVDNMGFSIPSNVVAELIPYLENGEKPIRPLIGVTITEIRSILENPDPKYIIPEGVESGLYVINIVPNSVAHKGGILIDDIILSFNGVELYKTLTLRIELNKIVVGSNTNVEVRILRDNKIITVTLVF